MITDKVAPVRITGHLIQSAGYGYRLLGVGYVLFICCLDQDIKVDECITWTLWNQPMETTREVTGVI